jgi:hypothetical protein
MEPAAQVGYMKQQSYNQRVQAGESAVDKIAGMDVVKAEDKQLLQQKLSNSLLTFPKLPVKTFPTHL